MNPIGPRGFWTRAAAQRWATEHNPHPRGTDEFYRWVRAYWDDQADRAGRRAAIAGVIALAASIVSTVITVWRVLS